MKHCTYPMPVFVHAYTRRRLGRWENVSAHCRSNPRT